MQYNPYPYQARMTKAIIENPAIGLFAEMGLGKTVSTLTAINELIYERFLVGKVLVIAPLFISKTVWKDEIAKWDHLNHIKISHILGSETERKAGLARQADLYVINRENVVWLVDLLGIRWPFEMVVIDELSSFKNCSSQRFRALRKVRPLIKRIVGLTGTPSPNGLIDLWSQVYLLDKGLRLGATLGGYQKTYFIPGKCKGYVVFNWIPKPMAETEIYEKIEDICISMKAKDWIDLPDVISPKVLVELPEKARMTYKALEKNYTVLLEGGVRITALQASTVMNKLLQVSNGAVYSEEGLFEEVHDAKLEALEALIDAADGNPVLVFYNYKHDKSRILNYLKEYKPRCLEKPQDIIDWNNKKVQVMIAHPASTGHGLNLQAGGSIIVWFGLTWNLEHYLQANARLFGGLRGKDTRIGIIHHIIAKGTVDEDVYEALVRKELNQDKLMVALKARIEENGVDQVY